MRICWVLSCVTNTFVMSLKVKNEKDLEKEDGRPPRWKYQVLFF